MEKTMGNEVTIINTDKRERPSKEMDYAQVRQLMYRQYEGSRIVIMVMAYGRIEKTRTCVESVLKYTTHIPFELWLLDNGTEENDILEYFKTVEYEPKKIFRVTKNITGCFAVNKLLHTMEAEYFVLLSNDLVLTKNWLDNLLICADSDPRIAMVNPVSTNISNRQEETLGGFADLEEMQKKAAEFNKSDWRKWEERLRIIPTATLYRREIFDVLGMFDVGFIHEFGDDDLSFRIRRAGYRMMLCKDTFIHHNHYLGERDVEGVEIKRAQMGRKIFSEKYPGLDAWNDGMNHIMDFSYYGNLRKGRSELIHILGVDVRCGTPIFDVKNKLRLESYTEFSVDAFTTDLKYYIDLNSISDSVEHDNISNLTSKYRGKKYDVVVLGEALNIYQSPVDVLLDLVSLLDMGGILIFHMHNTDNIYEFLWQQGVMEQRESGEYQRMSYKDVINILKDTPLEKLDIDCGLYSITDELRNFAEQRAYPGLQEGREERVQNLYIKEYWFWGQKA